MVDPQVMDGGEDDQGGGEDGDADQVISVPQTTNESDLELIEVTWIRTTCIKTERKNLKNV